MSDRVRIQTTINGEEREFLCEPRQSLLEVLRDTLLLIGAKEGCNNGNCGACNVIMDGVLVNSCLVLASKRKAPQITTIEGIALKDGLHPLQQKFLEHAALQCGICTPGFIVSAKALLDQQPGSHRSRKCACGWRATSAAAPATTRSCAPCWMRPTAQRWKIAARLSMRLTHAACNTRSGFPPSIVT